MPEVAIIDSEGKLQKGTLLTSEEIEIFNDDDLIEKLYKAGKYGYFETAHVRRILTAFLQDYYVRRRVQPTVVAKIIQPSTINPVEVAGTVELITEATNKVYDKYDECQNQPTSPVTRFQAL